MDAKKQTAIEWLEIELEKLWVQKYLSPITVKPLIEQAKAMEKEQIMEAVDAGFDDGSNFIEDIKFTNSEQYYNQTYGN